jgi:RNA polymerase sigma-70 factor, ECF subfamily
MDRTLDQVQDLEALVDRHGRELHVYLWRMLQDEVEAEDCLQETFLRAFRALPRLEAGSNPRAWLYVIAANVGRTWLKKRSLEARWRAATPLENAAGGDDEPANSLDRAHLAAAVDRLPRRQREALILRKYQGLDYATIAALQGNTPAAARANVYQALRRLRRWLSEKDR